MSTTVSTTFTLPATAATTAPAVATGAAAVVSITGGKVNCAHSVLISSDVSDPPLQDSRPNPKEFDPANTCPVQFEYAPKFETHAIPEILPACAVPGEVSGVDVLLSSFLIVEPGPSLHLKSF